MSAFPQSLPGEAVCPYCRAEFEPDEEVKACPACGTPHHADCFAENGGCTIFGCTAAPAEEAKITLTPTDLAPPAAPSFPGSSLYNFRTPYQAAGPALPVPAAAPPPPRPDGSPEPPPLVVAPYPAYAYASYVRPKSRVAFILLAVFLGSFGAHNFYAGYNKKAAIQICLTLFTCFYASPITWIWAIVEACTVSTDDDGVALT